jgi:DNA-directed RNA polymerase subunit RPC12/RpoP
MSLRVLYRQIQPSKRLCNYYRCQKPILRNIDRDKDGRIYHHGCLLSAKEERYSCLECFMRFDATEAAFQERLKTVGDQMQQVFRITCPGCGSENLKQLRDD